MPLRIRWVALADSGTGIGQVAQTFRQCEIWTDAQSPQPDEKGQYPQALLAFRRAATHDLGANRSEHMEDVGMTRGWPNGRLTGFGPAKRDGRGHSVAVASPVSSLQISCLPVQALLVPRIRRVCPGAGGPHISDLSYSP